MIQMGIPVPPGFVILSTAFEKFLGQNDLNAEINAVLKSVNIRDMKTVESASKKIEKSILKASIPKDIAGEIKKFFKQLGTKYVAVRSSATAEDSANTAWAGQLETYLNTTEKNLLENIKKCWASLFTPRAIFYRFENKLNKQKISVAVVVQKMIESEMSGVAFSVHPVTQNKNQIIIEAGFGLGEAIVSGQITPDSYVVDKKSKRIADKNIHTQAKGIYRAKNGGTEWRNISAKTGGKQALSDKKIIELSKIILEIENNLGFPCDIEWAFDEGKIYILQSRPITSISKTNTLFNQIWIKRWAGSYTFISCDYWGKQYHSSLKKHLGIGFDHCLFIHKQGVVSFFLLKDEFHNFGKKMSEIAVKNPSRAKKWLTALKENTDHITLLMKKLMGKLPTFKEYEKFLFYYNRHLPFHNFMKKTVDFLPQQAGEVLLPLFKEARVYSEHVYSDTERFFRGLAKVIAKQSGYNHNNLTCLSQKELEKYLKTKKLPPEKILKKRYKCSALLFKKGKSSFLFDEKVKKIEKQIFDTLHDNKNDIKGSIAYTGIATGIARIVLDPHKPGKFNNGDILVTGMTRPEFLPLVQKASAIVTDAGGVLCHAAIIARELKKPCIVGTEIATKLIKGGQTIRVDAENGVISVIK